MTKNKAGKIAKALGLVITEEKIIPTGGVNFDTTNTTICKIEFLPRINSSGGKDCIRLRIWELLDELKLLYNYHRDGSQSKIRINEKVSYKEVWNSGLFADIELSEKEQNLLIWLDEKEKK